MPSLHGDRLVVDGIACDELARRFGTPLHVISESRLRSNARLWRTALAAAWPHGPGLVMPSIKANHRRALRMILNQEGMGCDVFGSGELELALTAGIPGSSISLGGATKPDSLIERAIGAGVRITLDSADEFDRAAAIASRLDLTAQVRFRLRPRLDDGAVRSDFEPSQRARDAILAYRAGMPWHEVLACFARLADHPRLHLTGLMAHITRQSRDLRLWQSFGRAMADAAGDLHDLDPGWRPRELDIGGGFAAARDPLLPESTAPAPTPLQYLDAVLTAMAGRLAARGIDPEGIAIEVEPGRAMYADAGVHIATVLHVKHEPGAVPRTWIETDTSEAFLPDTIIERNHWRVLPATEPGRSATIDAAITGISCGWDVLRAHGPVPEVLAGEQLVFLDTGAYQDAASSNFNAMGRPATVLVHDGEADLLRPRESLDHVMAGDRIPERLAVP